LTASFVLIAVGEPVISLTKEAFFRYKRFYSSGIAGGFLSLKSHKKDAGL